MNRSLSVEPAAAPVSERAGASMTTDPTAPDESRVGETCDRLLELLRQTCGKDLNDDGTEWCARRSGHDGECRPLPGGVRF